MSDPFELADDIPAPTAMPAAESRFLKTLNDSQREAVAATDGPILVLAGAGTGKTRVLTTRLAHILQSGLARPWEVLAVTFTNKAAREMRERVASLIARPVEGWWVGTFHAVGARILRAHAETVGLRPNFTILDDDDQIRLLKQLLDVHDIDEKRWPARALLATIQRWKDRGLVPAKVSAAEGSDAADGKALALYAEYQDRLKALNAADFGDLLLHNLTLFATAPDVLAKYQRQFRYILVDEYQDTNVAQYLWLRLLAQTHRNICCVGDDDQSIYSWRGAEVGNILRFDKDFPGAKVVRLERNYRSTPHILAAASGLIAHNEGRLGKTLWTDLAEGEKVRVFGSWDGMEEARRVCDEIEALRGKGESFDEMAILVRAGFQTREFEERLIALAIPYRVVGGLRFYERQEIRDALAYLRVIHQPDDDLAFERIVNVPKRGLGAASLQSLHALARAQGLPLTAAAARVVETDELKPKARKTLAELIASFDRWRELLGVMPHTELTALILEESGYNAMWKAQKTPDASGRVDNLKELVSALEEFESLADFLEHVSLVMENAAADEGDKVTMMTLHGAKGLEFDNVFLPGWEEGLFPHQRALDEGGLAALEEERRLAYVGITRAKRRAFISFAANRRMFDQWQTAIPSRFLEELPAGHLSRAQPRGLWGGGFARGGGEAETAGLAEAATPFVPARYRRGTAPWRAEVAPSRDPDASPYVAGQRVFHQKFGYGRILSVEGDKLEVAFDKAGTKKVLDSFVETA